MKLDRLLAIAMYLLDRRRVTAGELADAFQVSVRTIYRDLEAIDLAGIPVVAYQGVGGGYGVDERFTMSRSAFRPEELKTLVMMLKGVNRVLRDGKLETTIGKIHAMGKVGMPTGQQDSVVLDLTPWGGSQTPDKVALLRKAIEGTRLVSFSYLNTKGEDIRRTVEPVILVLKGFTWYLYAYCRLRGDYRLFRVSRMTDAAMETGRFRKRDVDLSSRPWEQAWDSPRTVNLRVKIDAAARGRVEELFAADAIHRNPDGSCEVRGVYPDDTWLHGILLGLGSDAVVLDPPELRDLMRDKALAMAKRYGPPAHVARGNLPYSCQGSSDRVAPGNATTTREVRHMTSKQLIAYCGLDCAVCPAYTATVANDDDLRRKTAEQWSKEYGGQIKPQDINCLGCTVTEGPKLAHCSVCEIRACGAAKGLSTCAPCAEYPCAKLDKFFASVPTARATLDGLRPTA